MFDGYNQRANAASVRSFNLSMQINDHVLLKPNRVIPIRIGVDYCEHL